MPKKKVEIYEKDQLIYPFIESDHVTFSNGMKVNKMLDQNISMPTVTHEDLSFKVGVGDQDVSSAIVDSSVAEMTIKGKTYQNILPEPSTHVLTNNKEMFKVNEGLDPNVEIVDGVSKSAILKGNTLVNLVVNSSVEKNVGKSSLTEAMYDYIYPLENNKEYTFQFEISNFNATQPITCSFDNGLSGTDNITIDKNGVYKTKFTTTDKKSTQAWFFWTMTSWEDGNSATVKNIIILKGDHTNVDIPYFEGMQSVKMPVLKTNGKNLCNRVRGYHSNTGGTQNSWASFDMSCKPNTTYTAKIFSGSNNRFGFFSGVGVVGSTDSYKVTGGDFTPYTGGEKTFTITTGNNDNVMWVYLDNNSIVSLDDVVVQVEESPTATTYEPHKSNILTVNEDVELGSVGEVKDELNLLTGQLTQRTETRAYQEGDEANSEVITDMANTRYKLPKESIKTVDLSTSGNWEKIVLDGSEDEAWARSTTNNNYFVECNLPDRLQGVENNGWVDILPMTSVYTSNVNIGACIVSSGGLRIRTKEILNGQSLEEWKQHLSQNPITVWYQINTHKDSTKVKQPIFFKDGHIQLSSRADNSLISILDYQAKTSNSYVMDLMKANTRYTMKAKSASGTFTIDGTSYGAGANGTFTTPSSMTNKFLVMSNKANEEVMVLEGDVTDKTISYFKGIKSAFEGEDKIEVLSTNRNLWTGADNYANSGAKIILHNENECIFEHHSVNNGIKVKVEDYEYQIITMSYDFEILDGKALNVGGHNRHETKAYYIDGVNVGTGYHNGHVATYQNNRVYHVDHVVHINLPMGQGAVAGEREYIGIEPNRYSADTPTYCKMRVTNFQITLGKVIQEYEPHKSNSTKIPLLSPLRSLPDGTCDELIIDRESNKAKIIQRVGDIFVNGSEKWNNMEITTPTDYVLFTDNRIKCRKDRHFNNVSNSFPVQSSYDRSKENCYVAHKNQLIFTPFTGRFRNLQEFKQWLSQNPTTVYYELAAPVITEVDLEGFPYIYKDGHIFLNSEIVPTTEIVYSINQCQQISASNEDIIRHEKELTYLQKLIAQYIQVDYESALLSLKV